MRRPHWNDLIKREEEIREAIRIAPDVTPELDVQLTTILAAKAVVEAIWKARE